MDNQDLTKQPPIPINTQEQEMALLSILATIDSQTDDEDENEESSQSNGNYSSYFQGYDFEDELGFLESNYSDEDMEEEDEIDPDELTYEELIALGEFIGEEKRGLSMNQISNCLRSSKFGSENRVIIDRCVVCQVEYEEGESLVALPCEHPYHSACISKWLQIKKVCPICATEPPPSSSSSSPP